MKASTFFVALALGASAAPASAEQLYSRESWANMASDNKAQMIGDIVTVLIFESASTTNQVETRTGKNTSLDGGFSAGGVNESLSFGLGGNYRGGGETERSDRFVASMAASIVDVFPNGDFLIEGTQFLFVNDERRTIEIKGRVRPIDISADNTVISSRLANAEINYEGEGYVSRSAKPGLLNRIFSFLGIG